MRATADNAWRWITMILVVGFISLWLKACQINHDHKVVMNEGLIYRDLQMRIVSVQSPTHWRNGKYHGIDKRWLLQSLSDTTLYCEWNRMNDSTYFSAEVGDTVHFDYIRKDRFFHVKQRKK
jgi:hypothetical protein